MNELQNRRASRSHRPRQRGVSLLELMIGMFLGVLVLGGMIQVFSASRTSFQLTEGISRNQEGGRFAMDYLLRDLRMAGHFGCVGDQGRLLNAGTDFFTLAFAAGPADSVSMADYDALPWPAHFHISVQGYNADLTRRNDDFSLPPNPTTGGSWTPALPAPLDSLAVAGSDVIVLRYFSPESITVDAITGGSAPTVSFNSAQWPLIAAGTASPGVFGLADCTYATVFQGTPSTGQVSAVVGAGEVGFRELYEPGLAQLHRAESVAYYVGISAVSGQPALFRCRAVDLTGSCTPEELVEGVENLQFLYGLTDMVRGRPTGNITQLVSADALGDATASDAARAEWLRVGAIQMGIVMRHSAERSGGDPRQQPFSVLGSRVDPPPNDMRVRTVYETSIALRNRLFGN